jgi:hypothetical protein
VAAQQNFAYPRRNFPIRLDIHWHWHYFTWCPTPKRLNESQVAGTFFLPLTQVLAPSSWFACPSLCSFARDCSSSHQLRSQLCPPERPSLYLVSNKTASLSLWTLLQTRKSSVLVQAWMLRSELGPAEQVRCSPTVSCRSNTKSLHAPCNCKLRILNLVQLRKIQTCVKF